jgi:hypothetical protein
MMMMTVRRSARGRAAIAEPYHRRPKRPQACRACGRFLLLLAAFLLFPRAALANGADLPPEVVLQAYVKEEPGRLLLLLRVPLDLLASFGLPKRSSGHLDLANIEPRLRDAATAAGRQVELAAEGVALSPSVRRARVSLLSDRSFASYAAARAHMDAAPLPPDTELFWNQGFFDAELELPLPSVRAHLAVRVNVAPELGARLKLQLQFLPLDKPARRYVLPGGSDWVALDPRVHEAASIFFKSGFRAALTLERLVFFACLFAPFWKLRAPVMLIALFIVLQALAVSAVSLGVLSDARWIGIFFDATLAGAIVLVAIGNLAAPSLRVRLVLSAVVGVIGGFALSPALASTWQFSGAHVVVSAIAFNAGIALASVIGAAIAFALLRGVLDRILGAPLVVVVASALLGHMAWHWLERYHELGHELAHASLAQLVALALSILAGVVLAVLAESLPRWRMDAPRIPALLPTVFKHGPLN